MIDYCQEYGEIIAIIPIVNGQCQHTIPFNTIADSIPASSITLSAIGKQDTAGYIQKAAPSASSLFLRSGFYVDGYAPSLASTRTIIEIRPNPTIKGSFKRDLSGQSFTVKITARTEEEINHVQGYVNQILQSDCFDLFLVDTNQRCYLVRGVYPATSIKFDHVLPVYNNGELSFEIHCVNGVQPITT